MTESALCCTNWCANGWPAFYRGMRRFLYGWCTTTVPTFSGSGGVYHPVYQHPCWYTGWWAGWYSDWYSGIYPASIAENLGAPATNTPDSFPGGLFEYAKDEVTWIQMAAYCSWSARKVCLSAAPSALVEMRMPPLYCLANSASVLWKAATG